ncbi:MULTISPECIES: nuclear transport factor 2 family protein [Flavobacterium]|uniref:nuclear transport factor 2 family protein n=1 Tax=Flavobacterium TaxID=237 RepID=UPI001183FC1F|nr:MULTISPECIES: nuclear transport factor 2 family protein [Flavobacterium]MCR4029805.1 nuclear transport factor 2 family protein [Flavobacterium panacis]
MKSSDTKESSITAVITDYFNGIYNGDVPLLQSVFHPQAIIGFDLSGETHFKTLNQYLEGVKNRKSPNELGEEFKMKILSLEIINNTAVAKVQVPIFEYDYYDFLSLIVVDEKWVISNKLASKIN